MKLAQLQYYSTAIGSQSVICENGACKIPKLYDISVVKWLTVHFRLTGMPAGEMSEYLAGEDLRNFRLDVNGQPYQLGSSVINGDDYLAVVLDQPCDINGIDTSQDKGCLTLAINPDKMFPSAPPYPVWTLALHFTQLKPELGPANPDVPKAPLTSPERIIRQRGALNINTEETKAAPGASAVRPGASGAANLPTAQLGYPPRPNFTLNTYIQPPDKISSYWLKTIGESVSSARCMSCHAMDSLAKIQDHHQGIQGEVVMVPSALNPNQQIHSCQNCHACGPENCQLAAGDFAEGRWGTPTQVQNINWAALINDNPQNWPAVVCQRMKSNLTTAAKREEHFHEDYRLFWAVADGYVIGPGGGQLDTAPPHSYSSFLNRFDIWNKHGAPCPTG